MQIIENNPFRILGVWTNSPLRSLHANVTRMKAYLKVGKDISFPSDLTSFLPDITRSEALITQASASLNLSQDRIKYALFWFIEASSIDNVALGSLQKGDIVKAKNVLTKKETFSSLINEAVIDFIQDNPEDAIRKLSSVIHTDSYRSDLVHAICGESFNIEEITLSQIFIEALNEELSIDVISSSLNDDDKELFVFPCRRENDRKEHAVDRNAKCICDQCRENVAGQCAQQRSERPARDRGQHQPGHIGGADRIVLPGCDREDLVCDAKAHKKPLRRFHLCIRLLGNGDAHEGIAQVDDKLCQHHFCVAAGCRHDVKSGKLSGGGQICQGNEDCLPDGKTVCNGGKSEGEAD